MSHPLVAKLTPASRAIVRRAFATRPFTGDIGDARAVFLAERSTPGIVLAGIGDRKTLTLRRASRALRGAILAAKAARFSDVIVRPSDLAATDVDLERLTEAAVEQVSLASYTFSRYKTTKAAKEIAVRTLTLVGSDTDLAALKRGVRTGRILAQALDTCRDLANAPAGHMTPHALAAAARDVTAGLGLRIEVLGEAAMKKLGMGGLLGVSSGSHEEAQLITIEYPGPTGAQVKDAPLVFVGKGITFDSGGVNLKPTNSLNEMHMDMSGGAAVIAALTAIATLKLPVHVVGIVAAAENMPSGSSYRPGDILHTMSGKTIEVGNTDAEGRVVLADALTYAKRYKPRAIVDVATLTGAVGAALGNWVAAAMGTDDRLLDEVVAASRASGDEVWPFPLWEEFQEQIAGTFGDVTNDPGRGGRSAQVVLGGAFLAAFAEGTPFVHVDIGGTMSPSEGMHLAKGATGTGVRLLVELARRAATRHQRT